MGVTSSFCPSGATLDATTANCLDGTPTVMRAAEFEVQLLRAGTSVQIPALSTLDVTFVDVDGDSLLVGDTSTSLYEVVAVPSATSRTFDTTSTLIGDDTFTPSNTLYAIASQNLNVATDFTSNPLASTIPSVSAPAVATFHLASASSFKMLVGARSAVPSNVGRGFCFYLFGY